MKKIYLLVASAFIGAMSFGQQNLGLETWSGGHPSNWGMYAQEDINMNAIATIGTASTTPVVEASSAAEGSKAATLTSFTLSGSMIPQVPNGDYGAVISQLFATTDKIETVNFQYQSTIGATDSALILVEVYSDNGDFDPAGNNIIGQGVLFIKGNNTGWTSGSVNVTYFSATAAQSARIVAVSSAGQVFGSSVAAIVPGSILEVDDFQIEYLEPAAANVTNVVASDIANNGNGLDLQVTFDVPAAEATDVDKYYAIAFAPGISPGMLQDPSAFIQSAGNEITPNGSNQTYTFSGAPDATGVYFKLNAAQNGIEPALIEENIPMVVWIYVVAQPGKTDVYAPSNQITLTSAVSVKTIVKNNIKVFPNPATDVLNIDSSEEVKNVSVLSLDGKLVSTTNGKQVDVSTLKAGVYIYEVTTVSGEKVINKFMKK